MLKKRLIDILLLASVVFVLSSCSGELDGESQSGIVGKSSANANSGGFYDFGRTSVVNSYLKFIINAIDNETLVKYVNASAASFEFRRKKGELDDYKDIDIYASKKYFIELINSVGVSADSSKSELGNFLASLGYSLRFDKDKGKWVKAEPSLERFIKVMDDVFLLKHLLDNFSPRVENKKCQKCDWAGYDWKGHYSNKTIDLQDVVNSLDDNFGPQVLVTDHVDSLRDILMIVGIGDLDWEKSPIDFDSPVDFRVADYSSGKEGYVKFRPEEVITQVDGNTINSRYINFHRGSDGKWVMHADEDIQSNIAELIGVPQLIRFARVMQ